MAEGRSVVDGAFRVLRALPGTGLGMTDGGEQVLEIRDVRHRYGGVTALDGVGLEVRAGECVALLGPNGAGKTTLIGLATGLLAAQAGRVRVSGGVAGGRRPWRGACSWGWRPWASGGGRRGP